MILIFNSHVSRIVSHVQYVYHPPNPTLHCESRLVNITKITISRSLTFLQVLTLLTSVWHHQHVHCTSYRQEHTYTCWVVPLLFRYKIVLFLIFNWIKYFIIYLFSIRDIYTVCVSLDLYIRLDYFTQE